MKSLELNWIRKVDRSLVMPEVVFSNDTGDAGAMYYWPLNEEHLIDDQYYDLRNGLIVINPEYPEEVPGHIAHEWRHHWQYWHGLSIESKWNEPDNPSDWEGAITDYFVENPHEFDALLFERRFAPDKTNGLFFQWVSNGYKRRHPLRRVGIRDPGQPSTFVSSPSRILLEQPYPDRFLGETPNIIVAAGNQRILPGRPARDPLHSQARASGDEAHLPTSRPETLPWRTPIARAVVDRVSQALSILSNRIQNSIHFAQTARSISSPVQERKTPTPSEF